jgi:hypothetical protein
VRCVKIHKWEILIEIEDREETLAVEIAEEVILVEEEALVGVEVVIEGQEKCLIRFALIVARTVRFLFVQPARNLFIAVIALRKWVEVGETAAKMKDPDLTKENLRIMVEPAWIDLRLRV